MFRKFFAFILVLFVLSLQLIGVAVAATVAPPGVAVAAEPTAMQWVTANLATIFLVLLGISESLALLPWFKGNGIMDMIIKALRTLAGKPPAA
jgi:hypothetical protein